MNVLYAKVTGLNIYTVEKMATEAAEEVNCRCLLSFLVKIGSFQMPNSMEVLSLYLATSLRRGGYHGRRGSGDCLDKSPLVQGTMARL